ncbi:MAG: 30S ribosomal protein S13 [Candidatus Aenigmarchaeota archaeon ex4484_14]|nr:MAG: 30S ribosomal protein S13 [Candidatus Aenigmarchaeota archaeon ex4484_14]
MFLVEQLWLTSYLFSINRRQTLAILKKKVDIMGEMTETKKIVRLINTDLDGNLSVARALQKIKGIGPTIVKAVCIKAKIDMRTKLGSLSQDEINRIEEVIKKSDFPHWITNARSQTEKTHLVSSKIDFELRKRINVLRQIRAYRGIRHEQNLPVRGQRTRGSFRHNKTVGVQKRKALQAKRGKK